MNGFKRLCLFLYGLFGLCALAALFLTWVGPWTQQARAMLEVKWYYFALVVMVCITAIGLVVDILRALFTPSNTKETVIATIDGGVITVTRNAIVAQVKSVIEEDESCKATNVRVVLHKNNYVRVRARIKPLTQLDVVSYSEDLHRRLGEGLRMVCGDAVKSIDLAFVEPAKRGQVEEEADATGTDDAGISVDPSAIAKEEKREEKERKREREAAEREERRNRRRNNRGNTQPEEPLVLKVRNEVLESVSDQAIADEDVEDVEPIVVTTEPEQPVLVSGAEESPEFSETIEFAWEESGEPKDGKTAESAVQSEETDEGEEA